MKKVSMDIGLQNGSKICINVSEEMRNDLEIIFTTMRMLGCTIKTNVHYHESYKVINTLIVRDSIKVIFQNSFTYNDEYVDTNLIKAYFSQNSSVYSKISLNEAYERLIDIF